MYYACMVAVQIRDIPEAVRDVLAERAREAGQSLNSYLRDVVLREAAFAGNRQLIDQLREHSRCTGVTTGDVIAALDSARARSDT